MDSREEVENRGFALRHRALSRRQLGELLALLDISEVGPGRRRPHALRNILWNRPGLAAALTRYGLDMIATDVLASLSFPINALYFDKTVSARLPAAAPYAEMKTSSVCVHSEQAASSAARVTAAGRSATLGIGVSV